MGTAIPLGDVLSVTTGALVSRDHIGGVYRVCDHMTGASNMTHQLPRVCEQITPVILQQHPELAEIKPPRFGFPDDATAEQRRRIVFEWLAEQEARYGETVDLEPLAMLAAVEAGVVVDVPLTLWQEAG